MNYIYACDLTFFEHVPILDALAAFPTSTLKAATEHNVGLSAEQS